MPDPTAPSDNHDGEADHDDDRQAARHDDDSAGWANDDLVWADDDRGDQHGGDRPDFNVDDYPTVNVTGHHYVLVERADNPFVIVNNDAAVRPVQPDTYTTLDGTTHTVRTTYTRDDARRHQSYY